jgi:hypothetical protein
MVMTSSSTTTTLACAAGGFDGLRCVLSGGLHRPGCPAESFPRRIERRFARAVTLVDRAQGATNPIKAGRKLRHVARLLDKTAGGVEHLGTQGKAGPDCVTVLSRTLADGERRAIELAMAP